MFMLCSNIAAWTESGQKVDTSGFVVTKSAAIAHK